MLPHFMLVPSLACQASCSYCFGPHQGPVMPEQMLDSGLEYITLLAEQNDHNKVKVTFHGGEPLMAGGPLIRRAIEGLHDRFGKKGCEIAIQSNLWLLDDDLCRLFHDHNVSVGTSLDGPEEITDSQRGAGYFARTMANINKAREAGLDVGCIATFTNQSLPRWREVFDFFLEERLNFSIHKAVAPLEGSSIHTLSPEQYSGLINQMLDYYVENRHDLSIASLDEMCRSVGSREGQVCTFRDCLGMFIAIDPNGDLFPCQRLAGRPQYRLGNLATKPTFQELQDSHIARRIKDREEKVRLECSECSHLDYCKGGCLYNAWAGGNGRAKDPYCQAYQEIFDRISDRIIREMAAEENISAAAEIPWNGRGHPLLRKGPLIDLAREGTHPCLVARTAKRIIAAVELARGPDIKTLSERLHKMGICRSLQSAELSLQGLVASLHPDKLALNNLYIHTTFGCQLKCNHCYARADSPGQGQEHMPVEMIERLIHEAKVAGFRQVILTGGEPLIHPDRDRLLDTLKKTRPWAMPMNLILRTNFALPFEDKDMDLIAAAFDQVVASVDGNELSHDARRGPESYQSVVRNIERYQGRYGRKRTSKNCMPCKDWAMNPPAELSVACVMRAAEIQGEFGHSVRELGNRLDIRRVRFRPLLPLGRAIEWDEPPTSEALGGHSHPLELIENNFQPVASCGLGQNLYIEPSGESFPCYAYHRQHSLLGNVLETSEGLSKVLNSPAFQELSRHHVDTNCKCRDCEYRYLCGGACRAWGGEATQHDLDAAPPECEGLKKRAMGLLEAAIDYLELE